MATAKSSKTGIDTNKARVARTKEAKPSPTSLAVAQGGVTSANDFAKLMGALMTDLIAGSVSAEVGNATCKAGSNLLKVVEMQYKYGSSATNVEQKRLNLIS